MEGHIEVSRVPALSEGDVGVDVLAPFRTFPGHVDAALIRDHRGAARLLPRPAVEHKEVVVGAVRRQLRVWR